MAAAHRVEGMMATQDGMNTIQNIGLPNIKSTSSSWDLVVLESNICQSHYCKSTEWES